MSQCVFVSIELEYYKIERDLMKRKQLAKKGSFYLNRTMKLITNTVNENQEEATFQNHV